MPRGHSTDLGSVIPRIARSGGRSTVGAVNDVDAAVALERELLDPACRVDPDRAAELLADDFVEIGKSGRVWSRDDVVATLAAEPGMDGITIGPMSGQQIAGLVVVRYTTHHDGGPGTVHRTGWWRQTTHGWRCWFHQATVVPEPAGEAAAIARVDRPVTQTDVEASLRAAGVSVRFDGDRALLTVGAGMGDRQRGRGGPCPAIRRR